MAIEGAFLRTSAVFPGHDVRLLYAVDLPGVLQGDKAKL
jgi:hypothetical protein